MIDANIYSEVFEILSYMDKQTVMKIPYEILNNIKMRKNDNYISNINPKDLFNLNNVERKTIEILSWLDVNYWMEDEKKKVLKQKCREKRNELELRKKEKYNTIFFENNKNFVSKECVSIIKPEKENILKKIMKKIKELLNKI